MIEILTSDQLPEYQTYVIENPNANYCHDRAWFSIIQEAYNKTPVYIVHRRSHDKKIDGALPSFIFNNILLGKQLISMPYLDSGGILANSSDIEHMVLTEFHRIAQSYDSASELRCSAPLSCIAVPVNEKVTMHVQLSDLDENSYWKKLDPKVRNQIRKADKSAVEVRWGRYELLEDFYTVFSRNMRDLGSPVHSKRFFHAILSALPNSEIGNAYRDKHCIGTIIRIQWRDSISIPWASTLKTERAYCPTNALYWESIRSALRDRYRVVDLGRSTIGEGTYQFKKQWLAQEVQLTWYQFDAKAQLKPAVKYLSTGPLRTFASLWAHLPLSVTNRFGPIFRGCISA